MKKGIWATILIITLSLSAHRMTLLAAGQENEITYNELSESLINEVIQSGEWVANEDGSYSFILTKQNALITKGARSNNNITEKSRINYTLIPITQEAKRNLDNAFRTVQAGGSKELTANDSAYYVSAYSIINWQCTTINSRDYVYLTSVSGGYSAQGNGSYIASGVTVTEQDVTMGQTGFTSAGTYQSQNMSKKIDVKSRSYSYDSSNFSNWLPVESTSGKSIMGSNYVITLQRGTSSWTCEITNNY